MAETQDKTSTNNIPPSKRRLSSISGLKINAFVIILVGFIVCGTVVTWQQHQLKAPIENADNNIIVNTSSQEQHDLNDFESDIKRRLLVDINGEEIEDMGICGRRPPFMKTVNNNNVDPSLVPFTTSTTTPTFPYTDKIHEKLLVIGDGPAFGRTNNHLLALHRGMSYAVDYGYDLAITKKGWGIDVLKLLFGPSEDESDHEWETRLELHLGVIIADEEELKAVMTASEYLEAKSMKMGDCFRYTFSQTFPLALESRRYRLRYLWSHPFRGRAIASTRTNPHPEDMCGALHALVPFRHYKPYVAIHVRSLEGQCEDRMGLMEMRMKVAFRDNQKLKGKYADYANRVDVRAPCEMTVDYIDDILTQSGMRNEKIVVLTDGQRPDIVEGLLNHPEWGKNVKVGIERYSWVGGDMMMAIMAHVFVGNPTSTLSANVARARVSLGFDPRSNYLFPKIMGGEGDDVGKVQRREFVFEDDECLFEIHQCRHGCNHVCRYVKM